MDENEIMEMGDMMHELETIWQMKYVVIKVVVQVQFVKCIWLLFHKATEPSYRSNIVFLISLHNFRRRMNLCKCL